MSMICILVVTVAAILGAMRIGGVTHWSFLMVKHIYVGFLFGAGWGIPAPVWFSSGIALMAVETLMFFYEYIYLRVLLHVDSGNPATLDPFYGTRHRLWGFGPVGRHERWARGEPVEAPSTIPLRPTPPPPPKRG